MKFIRASFGKKEKFLQMKTGKAVVIIL